MAERFDLNVILSLKDLASPRMRGFAGKVGKVGAALGRMGKKAALAGVAAGGAFGTLAIKRTEEYQSSMNMVGAVTEATAREFALLSAKAKELGATTQFSAVDAANAMKFMGMAGLRTNKILTASPKVLQLAAAAQLDMGAAADIVTNIMAGFGDKAGDLGKVNDVLVKAFTSSNVNLQQLGAGLRKAGPVASKLGFTFTETAAALGLLGSAGFQGEEAGVGLRRIMANLVAPTKAQQRAMKFLELELKNADGSVKSMVEVLKEFENAQKKGATESQIAAGALEIFGQRGGPQLLALLGQGSQALENLRVKLEESGGTAERVAKAQMIGLPGAMKEIASAWEAVLLAFGEGETGILVEQTIRGIADGLRGLAKLMPTISKDISDFIKAMQRIPDFFTGIWQTGVIEPIELAEKRWNEFVKLVKESPLGKVITLAAEKIAPKITPKFTPEQQIQAKLATEEARRRGMAAIGGPSQSEVTIKVQATDGTTATVENVRQSGNTKTRVQTDSSVGYTVPNLATVGFNR